MRLPVLIVLHQENSTPGRVGQALRERGYALDIRKPRFGDPLPETMADHAGAIVFGGPMSANDAEDFVRREIDWIAVPLKERKPLLGICLGAQMLAQHVGARVYPPCRRPRRDRLLSDPADRSRPVAVRSLAGTGLPMASRGVRSAGRRRAAGGRRQFPGAGVPLRLGGYGCSSIPTSRTPPSAAGPRAAHERMQLPNAKPRAAHFADRAVYDPAGRAWLAAFLNHWLGLETG